MTVLPNFKRLYEALLLQIIEARRQRQADLQRWEEKERTSHQYFFI
jgi:hypothetical protein